jgi:hypothetical protein
MTIPKTLSVPDAGREYFDLGRNASYDAAKRGDIPTIKIGRILRVPIVALDRMLERAGQLQEHSQAFAMGAVNSRARPKGRGSSGARSGRATHPAEEIAAPVDSSARARP